MHIKKKKSSLKHIKSTTLDKKDTERWIEKKKKRNNLNKTICSQAPKKKKNTLKQETRKRVNCN